MKEAQKNKLTKNQIYFLGSNGIKSMLGLFNRKALQGRLAGQLVQVFYTTSF